MKLKKEIEEHNFLKAENKNRMIFKFTDIDNALKITVIGVIGIALIIFGVAFTVVLSELDRKQLLKTVYNTEQTEPAHTRSK